MSAEPSRENSRTLRLLYWSARDEHADPGLESISANGRPGEEAFLERIPTRLDPSLCYEKLTLRPLQSTDERTDERRGERIEFTLLSAPGDPELAPVRMHLLDRVDAIVWTLTAGHNARSKNLASLEEMRKALGAYGRMLEDVPILVQIPESMDPADDALRMTLEKADLEPLAILRITNAESYREALEAITQFIRCPETGSRTNPLSTPTEDRGGPLSPSSAPAASEINTLLEESMLAEDEDAALEGFFEEISLHSQPAGTLDTEVRIAGGDEGLEIEAVGTATRRGKREVRLPLTLSAGPHGDSVPLTLRIELETGPGERKN